MASIRISTFFFLEIKWFQGEKKEFTVTDKYQHTPNPQAKAALNKDCSLHLGIPHSHWLDERKRTEGRMKQDASGIHLMSVKFLVDWYTH